MPKELRVLAVVPLPEDHRQAAKATVEMDPAIEALAEAVKKVHGTVTSTVVSARTKTEAAA